jgi:hypothetical protein
MKANFVYAEIRCRKCGYKQEITAVDLSEHRKKKAASVTYDILLPLTKWTDGGLAQVTVSI